MQRKNNELQQVNWHVFGHFVHNLSKIWEKKISHFSTLRRMIVERCASLKIRMQEFRWKTEFLSQSQTNTLIFRFWPEPTTAFPASLSLYVTHNNRSKSKKKCLFILLLAFILYTAIFFGEFPFKLPSLWSLRLECFFLARKRSEHQQRKKNSIIFFCSWCSTDLERQGY